jgi:hypothetical protein
MPRSFLIAVPPAARQEFIGGAMDQAAPKSLMQKG